MFCICAIVVVLTLVDIQCFTPFETWNLQNIFWDTNMFVSFPHTNGFLFFFTFKGSEWAENNITTSSLSSGGNLSSSFCITSTKAYKPEMKRLHEKHIHIQYHNIISMFRWKSIKFLLYNIYKSLQIKAEKYYTWETGTYTSVKPV